MPLEIRITTESASRRYEPEFFRIFASNLAKLFEARGLDGLLLGFPLTNTDESLKPDALIITRNVILIVDFKNFDKRIVKIPAEPDFYNGPWISREIETRTKSGNTVNVLGGASINPFAQLQAQVEKLKKVLPIEFRDAPIQTCVLFQGEVSVEGSIPGRYQRHFSIASKSNYLNTLEDSLNISSATGPFPFEKVKQIFRSKPYTDVIPIDLDAKRRLAELHTLWESESLAKAAVEEELLNTRLAFDAERQRTGSQSSEYLVKIRSLEAQFDEAQSRYDKVLAEFQLEKDNEQLRTDTAIELARNDVARARAENAKAKEERQKVEAEAELEKTKLMKKAIGFSNSVKVFGGVGVVGVILYLGSLALPLSQEDTAAPECVTYNSAPEYLGQSVCIEFAPLDVGMSETGRTYLNTTFGGFYVYIGDAASLYPGEDLRLLFEGKVIRVTGIVEERKNDDGSPRYSVSVTTATQIEIVD